jgi:invasion protein IalB
MELPESFVDVMKSGKKLTVAFIDSNNNKQVNIDLPLDGFAERLAEVKP